jgi:aquaporin Z
VTLRWAEYAIEGALLGTFMVSACVAVIAVEHPASVLRRRIPRAGVRRAIVGVGMGVTAVALIYSPWGQRSGAHMNPAVTLTFLLLGKVGAVDAAMYAVSQFIGGALGVLGVATFLRAALAHPSVNYVVTVPGRGAWIAWGAEFVISLGMMLTVLAMSSSAALAPFTGIAAGVLVAFYIVIAGPISGMSLNPARTFASAVWAREWRSFWVYATAPLLGMMAGGALFVTDGGRVACAKLCHGDGPCIFHCEISADRQSRSR